MKTIDRTSVITEAFNALGFKPRQGQLKICSDILSAFIDKNNTNVLLCADTGVGKSIIAAVVARVLSNIDNDLRSAVYISSTNSLVNQYAATFDSKSYEEFFKIKGASNYPCNYFKKMGNEKSTGEDCVYKELSEFEQNIHCKGCTYLESKSLVNNTENLITNYSYFMIGRLWTTHVKQRNLHVFDEAHLMNDVFCDAFGVSFDVTHINKQITELKDNTNGKCNASVSDLIFFRDSIKNKQIKESNYREWLKTALKIYSQVVRTCSEQAALIPDIKAKANMKKISGKYSSICIKIRDFFKHEYDHAFDDSEFEKISVKPIFISKMINGLLGKYNLFMTATLSPNFAETTLNLDPSKTAYIDAASVFPPENRPLFFIGKDSLNYTKMQDPNTFKEMGKVISLILAHHSNDKGILLAPSFSVCKQIKENLKSKIKIFEHKSGEKIVDVMKEFKNYKGPSLLMSPSIFEGLDFEGDQSRYQIIVKTPFASLGDKRIKKIANDYPEIYREIALYKIIQGIGRSIRSPSDTATTYFLDGSTKTLFDSNLNLWNNRFTVMK